MTEDTTAFPLLTDPDIEYFAGVGSRRSVTRGDYLYRQGDQTSSFFVVVSGAVDIVLEIDGNESIITTHGAAKFLGELNLLTGSRLLVSARVRDSGEVIVVGRDELHRILSTDPRMGDLVLGALLARRTVLLTGAAEAIRVIGSSFSPVLKRLREFLTRLRIPHSWLDPDQLPDVERVLRDFHLSPGDLPVVIANGVVLRRPTPGELSEYLGLTIESLPGRCFDLIVVGGGPAGLAASLYGASEGLATLGIEAVAVGGQAGTSSMIENYLGFPMGVSGADLAQRAVVQAEKFGASLVSPCVATSLGEAAGHLVVTLSDRSVVTGRAVIAATGARYRKIEAARLGDFEDTCVYYAATDLEVRQCAGSDVVVVGGGNSAGQAAMYLAENGCRVVVVIRADDLGKDMSRYLVNRIEAHEAVEVRTQTTITALDGDGRLEVLDVEGPSGPDQVACAALFSFIGADPGSDWLSGCASLDERGFVLTDRSLGPEHLDNRWATLARTPLPYETSYPGLFAVGDVRSGSTKRVAAAVGEGSAAVRSVHEYLSFTS